MKRSLVTLTIAALMLSIVPGCATMGMGKSPEEQVREELEVWRASLLAKDVDKLMASYSDDFTSNQGGSKAELRQFIQGAIDGGYLDNAEISFEDMVVTVEGDKAVAAPVALSGPAGGLSLKLELVKEEAGWLIVYSSEA